MLRVALIEDESVVLKGMAMVLKKENDIELVGCALNGRDGLDLIYRECPDIVLTDIRMPGITGLEMIERAKKQFPDIVYIIFSGFNEFKYVQKAIGLGVLDYLEKPVTVPNLKQALGKAKKIIEYKRNYIQMKERVSQMNRVLIEQALYKLIHEPVELEAECIEQVVRAAESLQYSTEIAVLCTGQIFHLNTGADEYRQMINEMTFSVVGKHIVEVFTLIVDKCLFFVYFNQECELFPFYEKIEEHKKRLEEQDISFYAGLSNVYQSIYELKNAFSEAHNALTYAEFLEENKIVKIEEVEFQNHIPMELTDSQYSLSMNFRLGNYKECRKQVEGYLDYLKTTIFTPQILKHECLEILYLLQNLIKESGMPGINLDGPFHKELSAFTSANDILEWTEAKAVWLMDYVDKKERAEESPNSIELVRKYIDAHYAESISLDILAEQVHMNPTYLSVIFKRDEGVSYSHYLTGIRMEHAKKFLEKGLKAKEVCEKVGYFDYRYFNKQFKKHTGMTPDTYKRSRLGENKK